MLHNIENGQKARNGRDLESYFSAKTGLQKTLKKDKPSFINSHGVSQLVDFDFHKVVGDTTVYLDLTTTYRSDRAKQKAYNALVYKNKFERDCKFYIVVGTVYENGRKPTVNLIEGLDGVISIEEAIKMVQ